MNKIYLRATGEIYQVEELLNDDCLIARNLATGGCYLFSKENFNSKVVIDGEEKPLFQPINPVCPLKAFSSEELVNELARRGKLPEEAEVKASCIVEETYKICRKLSEDNYVHLMKAGSTTSNYDKAVQSLDFFRSTEPNPENLYIVCMRSTVLMD